MLFSGALRRRRKPEAKISWHCPYKALDSNRHWLSILLRVSFFHLSFDKLRIIFAWQFGRGPGGWEAHRRGWGGGWGGGHPGERHLHGAHQQNQANGGDITQLILTFTFPGNSLLAKYCQRTEGRPVDFNSALQLFILVKQSCDWKLDSLYSCWCSCLCVSSNSSSIFYWFWLTITLEIL